MKQFTPQQWETRAQGARSQMMLFCIYPSHRVHLMCRGELEGGVAIYLINALPLLGTGSPFLLSVSVAALTPPHTLQETST